jgi:UDPglucose--hexose-1-phosphate uridylyltransferase
MSELRQNLATKEWVIISTERARRPHEFTQVRNRPVDEQPTWEPNCPFCIGNEELDLEVMRVPETGPWQVRIVGNRFPAVSHEPELMRSYAGLVRHISGVGYHEVIVETSHHNSCAALETPESVAEVFHAFIDRAWQIQADPRIEYILFFKNHGRQAGASLIHPHAQLIALPMVPTDVRVRADEARKYFDEFGACVFCEMMRHEAQDSSRIILETEHFLVFCPYASVSPFHTWVVPKGHIASFFHASRAEVDDLGRVMHTLLRKIYRGLNNPDYNYVIRTAPVRDLGAPYLHWYITIIPRISLAAGFELGSGIFINPSLPEECAAFLRSVPMAEGEPPPLPPIHAL